MSRFKDLSSDVYYELVRRYPDFKEEVRFILHCLFTLLTPPFASNLLPFPMPL
jgi:hypothetical protein